MFHVLTGRWENGVTGWKPANSVLSSKKMGNSLHDSLQDCGSGNAQSIGPQILLVGLVVLVAISFLMLCNAQAQIPTEGLVGYWSFDEGSASLTGGTADNGQPTSSVTFGPGKNGMAAIFHGMDNPGHIQIPNSSALQFSEGATYSAWVRVDSLVAMSGLGALFAKSHDQIGLVFYSTLSINGDASFSAARWGVDQGWNAILWTPHKEIGDWTHVVFTLSSLTGIRIYVDGQLYQTSTRPVSFSEMNGQDLFLGKFSDSYYPFYGAIDEFRIYNHALSAAEVQELVIGNNSGAAFSTWPDTGQTKCYDNSQEIPCPASGQPFYGQDAQYSGPARSYTKLDNTGNILPDSAGSYVMVKDNTTGLIWEMKDANDGAADYSNPNDADNTYTWCDTNTATNGGNQGACGENDSQDFITAINANYFGGHNDWRLPTIQELISLLEISNYPHIAPIFASTTQPSDYWSSTTSIYHPQMLDRAYFLAFYGSWALTDYKSYGKYVRAVRGGQQDLTNDRFVNNGDGTVNDTVTCLQWQKTTMDTDNDGTPDQLTWQQALAASESLYLGGRSDWRLPNDNELISLVDYGRFNPALDPVFTEAIDWDTEFWSSSTQPGNLPWAQVTRFFEGGHFFNEKTLNRFARAVRGQQCGSKKPVISQVSIGATATQIAGSFVVSDANGDNLKNMRLRLKDNRGITCSTGYFSAGFGQPVNPGTINFTTKDCVSTLNWDGDITYWVEAWDVRDTRADEATGSVVVASNTLLPFGSSIRWDSAPDTIIVGETTTLTLSVIDAAGNVVTGFSGVGGLAVTGIDVETDDNRFVENGRYVWFDNGIASITGFKAINPGTGLMKVVLAAQIAEAKQLAATSEVQSISMAGAGSTLQSSSEQITVYLFDPQCKPFNVEVIVLENGTETSQIVGVDFAKVGTEAWTTAIAMGGFPAKYKMSNLDSEQEYKIRISKPTFRTGFVNLTWHECEGRNVSQKIDYKTKQGRPILLLHGIMGSTLDPDHDEFPHMPKELCTQLDTSSKSLPTGCNQLDFYSPLAGDVLGWKRLETRLSQMGYTVYPVAWDWRLSLDDAAKAYLQPAITKAIEETGFPQVDVIGHSMGGLVTRWLIQKIGTTGIDRFVMLGTPNGGSVNAFYLLAAAEPILLDNLLDNGIETAFMSKFYTNVANNLTLISTGRQKALVTDDWGDADIDEDKTINDYTTNYKDTHTRRKLLQKLAPGGKVLLPLESNQFAYNPILKKIFQHKNKALDSAELDTYAQALSTLSTISGTSDEQGKLICRSKDINNTKTTSDAYTWLYLSKAQKTMTKAFVLDTSGDKSINEFSILTKTTVRCPGCASGIATVPPYLPSELMVDNMGDGTVPTTWATAGLDSLVGGCIDNVKATAKHASLTADDDVLFPIFDQLVSGRTDLVRLPQFKADANQSTETTSSIKVRVGEPLPAMLAANGIQFGSNGTTGEFFPTPDGAHYTTTEQSTGLGIQPFSPGENVLTIYPGAHFINRLIRIEISSVVDSALKQRLAGMLFVDSTPLVLSFTVAADGKITLVNRPSPPVKTRATFINNQTEMVINWSVPSTGIPEKYKIFRREEGRFAFTLLGEVAGTITSYTATDSALPPGSATVANEYIIVAVHANGLTGFASDVVSNHTVTIVDPINFNPIRGAAGKWVTSNTVTIHGINVPVTISIDGGEYSIDGGAFTSVPGTISAEQTLTIRTQVPSLVTLTIGDVIIPIETSVISLTDAILYLQVMAGMQPDGITIDDDINQDGRIGLEEAIEVMRTLSQ